MVRNPAYGAEIWRFKSLYRQELFCVEKNFLDEEFESKIDGYGIETFIFKYEMYTVVIIHVNVLRSAFTLAI